MVYFKRDKFAGIAPGVSPRLLAAQFGQIADDVDLTEGRLLGAKEHSTTQTTLSADTRSLYRYEHGSSAVHYLQWEEDNVSVAKGPIPDDELERLYWTGEDYPRIGWSSSIVGGTSPYPTSSYSLGVPAPTHTPTAVASGVGDSALAAYEVSYQYTIVTADGREGPPSPASNPEEKVDGGNQVVTVSIPTPSFNTGNHNLGVGSLKRIYRSNTGSTSTQFQYVDQVPFTTTSYADTKTAAQLQEVIPSTTWIGPPDADSALYPDGPMQGLIPLAQGVMAGFSGNRFCLSEPFLPHAWPITYRITTDEPIVAIAASNNGVVALTKGRPYFITGTEPSAMTAVTVDLAQACVNPKSVVDMGEYVLYAGPDGLCSVQGAAGAVVTEGLITPDKWNALFAPSSYKAFLFEGKYVAFAGSASWIFDPTGGENTLTTFNDADVNAAYHDPNSGELYVSFSGDTDLKMFRTSGTRGVGTFKSKKFVAPSPISMGWISVDANKYPVTVKVWGDGTLVADYTLSESDGVYTQTTYEPSGINSGTLLEPLMRMPAVIAQEWEVQVGGEDINSFCLAQGIGEVKAT